MLKILFTFEVAGLLPTSSLFAVRKLVRGNRRQSYKINLVSCKTKIYTNLDRNDSLILSKVMHWQGIRGFKGKFYLIWLAPGKRGSAFLVSLFNCNNSKLGKIRSQKEEVTTMLNEARVRKWAKHFFVKWMERQLILAVFGKFNLKYKYELW